VDIGLLRAALTALYARVICPMIFARDFFRARRIASVFNFVEKSQRFHAACASARENFFQLPIKARFSARDDRRARRQDLGIGQKNRALRARRRDFFDAIFFAHRRFYSSPNARIQARATPLEAR
jgi:hypothetical protein